MQLHNKYTYMLIFPSVLVARVQSPTRESENGKWERFSFLFLSSFHAELKCWGDPTSVQAKKNNLDRVLRWRSKGRVTPGDWTSCKGQKPPKTVRQLWPPHSKSWLPGYTPWIGSLISPNTLSHWFSFPLSLLAALVQRPGDGPSLETPMTCSWTEKLQCGLIAFLVFP